VGGGAGFAVMLFIMAPFIVFVLLGVPVAVLTFLLGFYPVNNRPFSSFLESMLRYLKGGKLYLWRKKGTGVYKDANFDGMTSPTYMPPTNTSNLNSLSRRLELKAIQKSSPQ
jgi:hypothetical protein